MAPLALVPPPFPGKNSPAPKKPEQPATPRGTYRRKTRTVPEDAKDMATATAHPVARYVRHLAARHAAALPDDQLLDHYARRRDEAAFAALVRRHGPLVLGACRRVLRDGHAAEDAFQTTFIVLAQA